MAHIPISEGTSFAAVEVIQAGGEWHVRVVGAGKVLFRSFELETRAIDFAARQCLRLRLGKYDRV